MSREKNKFEIEKALEAHFQAPQPDNAFLEALAGQLENEYDRKTQTTSTTQEVPQVKSRRVNRWVMAPAFMTILFVLLVLVIGPKQVIAQVQALLGYVPGVGFVDVNDVRVLDAPVSQTKDDVTITIKQVLVNQEDTVVVFGIEGLPPEDEILVDLGPVTMENEDEWLERYQELWETDARILLPDGEVIDEQYFSGAPWDGYFTFAATLPSNVLDFSLEFGHIPGIIQGKAPEGWRFDVALKYVDSAVFEELPQALPLGIVSEPDPTFGVSIELLDITQSLTETALRVQINGVPEGWTEQGYSLDASLRDDLGNQYQVIYGPTRGEGENGIYLLTFQPVSPEATSLTLSAVNLAFRVPLENQGILVDVGDSPEIGDVFSLDKTIELLGTWIHFSSVRIHDEQDPYSYEDEPLVHFEFEIAPVPVQNKLAVMGIEFGTPTVGGQGIRMTSSASGGGIDPDEPMLSNVSAKMSFPADAPIPQGEIQFPISAASIYLQGPFEISLEDEAADLELPEPLPSEIKSETDPGFDISLELLDVTYSPTETALRLQINGGPSSRHRFSVVHASLQDNLGNQYSETSLPAGIQNENEDGVLMLVFKAVSPEASSLTLTIHNLRGLVELENQSILVDVGDSPDAGEQVPLDETIDVFGTPLHFVGVNIYEGRNKTAEGEMVTYFEFEIDPVPIVNNMAVTGILCSNPMVEDQSIQVGCGGGGGPESSGFSTLTHKIAFPADEPMPQGEILFPFSGANILLQGPFEFTWDVGE
jgi:hypothetical protein